MEAGSARDTSTFHNFILLFKRSFFKFTHITFPSISIFFLLLSMIFFFTTHLVCFVIQKRIFFSLGQHFRIISSMSLIYFIYYTLLFAIYRKVSMFCCQFSQKVFILECFSNVCIFFLSLCYHFVKLRDKNYPKKKPFFSLNQAKKWRKTGNKLKICDSVESPDVCTRECFVAIIKKFWKSHTICVIALFYLLKGTKLKGTVMQII